MAFSPQERADRIERYERGPKLIEEALARVPEEARRWRPAPGRWSAHEIVCHCADAENNGSARIRYVLAEKEPVVLAYDQEEWARTLDYHSHPLELALRCIEATRAHTASLIRRLPEEAWQRGGRHTESGAYTAEDWLRIYSEHLEGHARQIDGNLEAWRAQAR